MRKKKDKTYLNPVKNKKWLKMEGIGNKIIFTPREEFLKRTEEEIARSPIRREELTGFTPPPLPPPKKLTLLDRIKLFFTNPKPVIIAVRRITVGYPTHWDCKTSDGSFAYIRYYQNVLTWGIGKTMYNAIADSYLCNGNNDGTNPLTLQTKEMQKRLKNIFIFKVKKNEKES